MSMDIVGYIAIGMVASLLLVFLVKQAGGGG